MLSAEDKARLQKIQRQHSAPVRTVLRAKIILLAASEFCPHRIALRLEVLHHTVTKWIGRWSAATPDATVEQRLRDAPRPGAPAKFTPEHQCQIIALACEKPEVYQRPITHWTARELKEELDRQGQIPSISVRHLGRLLEEADLQPHRCRYWLNAKPDPEKEKKIQAVCHVYQQALEGQSRGEITYSVDEMTGIQALERIAPDHPMAPGQPVRLEFEYERHGTQALLAGLNVATGRVLGQVRETRKENDFVDLIDSIVRAHPQAKKFRFVADNLNTHQSASLVRYVARDSAMEDATLGIKGRHGVLKDLASRTEFLTDPTHRIVFFYTPKHASWMNQIEIWFGILVRKVIRRGSFSSKVQLKQKLEAFLDYFNRTMAKPYKWTYAGKPLHGPTTA